VKTIDRATLEIEPGETATAYVPIPLSSRVEKVDVDPMTAAHFQVVRADYIGERAMLAETGIRSPALRLVLKNASAEKRRARIFVDVAPDLSLMSRSLEGVAERFNREVFAARRRKLLS
jgi:hypothetical protein